MNLRSLELDARLLIIALACPGGGSSAVFAFLYRPAFGAVSLYLLDTDRPKIDYIVATSAFECANIKAGQHSDGPNKIHRQIAPKARRRSRIAHHHPIYGPVRRGLCARLSFDAKFEPYLMASVVINPHFPHLYVSMSLPRNTAGRILSRLMTLALLHFGQ
jgi:hypothetical protein